MLALGVVIAVVLAACGDGGSTIEAPTGAGGIEVTSDDLTAGGNVPTEFTCDGADEIPSLSWQGVPDGTQSVAIVVDDPDAPGGTFTHWIVWGVEPDTMSLDGVPDAATQGSNDFGQLGYRGPCPPEGDDPHTYRFRVLALDTTLDLERGADAGAFAEATEGHVIGEGVLSATYGR